eukprot:CAMPEP_0113823548 /NCGR_PEP_ID=MMETSP0328-20130328/2797_1 /TAXON_ID=39455 /ORGANISM="Alexandrium minutum" /LENGTH=154 /DNA_ID=CAMNT_0000791487 /DNA_START=33 /DNA_END=499 /DNA_ORIENTATION=+ /assembly_acc=CAM_ASM_000350
MAYFTAKWCSPCHMIAPHFEELAVSGNYPTTAFVKVDVDDAELIADKAGVNAMPTFQVWRDGSKLEEFSGADKPKLKELCDKIAAEGAAARVTELIQLLPCRSGVRQSVAVVAAGGSRGCTVLGAKARAFAPARACAEAFGVRMHARDNACLRP